MPSYLSDTSCDIFCAVVDNFGDAGVCWRLARQLSEEFGWQVRLWIDDLSALNRLVPAVDQQLPEQLVEGVRIKTWSAAEQGEVQPAAMVIEAFACELPATYRRGMLDQPVVWVNLEYLSAEPWVVGCHRLSSPQPGGLAKHFFFPGFSADTGGLLKERDVDAARTAFAQDAAAQGQFWQQHAGARPPEGALKVSLFAYANTATSSLLDAWAAGNEPVFLALPVSTVAREVECWLGCSLILGEPVVRGSLHIYPMPFLSQPDYDRLLWACDLNFVRGEDSFVRAQWAGKAFIWHIYPQEETAHLPKLEAFLDRFDKALPDTSRQALRRFTCAWNAGENIADDWQNLRPHLTSLATHTAQWAQELSQNKHLAESLVAFFCERRSLAMRGTP